jgi:hypothetical protein
MKQYANNYYVLHGETIPSLPEHDDYVMTTTGENYGGIFTDDNGSLTAYIYATQQAMDEAWLIIEPRPSEVVALEARINSTEFDAATTVEELKQALRGN